MKLETNMGIKDFQCHIPSNKFVIQETNTPEVIYYYLFLSRSHLLLPISTVNFLL